MRSLGGDAPSYDDTTEYLIPSGRHDTTAALLVLEQCPEPQPHQPPRRQPPSPAARWHQAAPGSDAQRVRRALEVVLACDDDTWASATEGSGGGGDGGEGVRDALDALDAEIFATVGPDTDTPAGVEELVAAIFGNLTSADALMASVVEARVEAPERHESLARLRERVLTLSERKVLRAVGAAAPQRTH